VQSVHVDQKTRPTGRTKRRYILSPMTGRLIQDLLEERGLKHKDLAAQVGYEVNYISNVVSKDEASTRFWFRSKRHLVWTRDHWYSGTCSRLSTKFAERRASRLTTQYPG